MRHAARGCSVAVTPARPPSCFLASALARQRGRQSHTVPRIESYCSLLTVGTGNILCRRSGSSSISAIRPRKDVYGHRAWLFVGDVRGTRAHARTSTCLNVLEVHAERRRSSPAAQKCTDSDSHIAICRLDVAAPNLQIGRPNLQIETICKLGPT